LKKYIAYLKKNYKQVAITAPTGIAATYMGGALDRDGNKKIYFRKRDKKLLKKRILENGLKILAFLLLMKF